MEKRRAENCNEYNIKMPVQSQRLPMRQATYTITTAPGGRNEESKPRS